MIHASVVQLFGMSACFHRYTVQIPIVQPAVCVCHFQFLSYCRLVARNFTLAGVRSAIARIDIEIFNDYTHTCTAHIPLHVYVGRNESCLSTGNCRTNQKHPHCTLSQQTNSAQCLCCSITLRWNYFLIPIQLVTVIRAIKNVLRSTLSFYVSCSAVLEYWKYDTISCSDPRQVLGDPDVITAHWKQTCSTPFSNKIRLCENSCCNFHWIFSDCLSSFLLLLFWRTKKKRYYFTA